MDAGLPGSGAGVGSFMPGGFDAYARILHPARVGDRDVPWAEIARWSGRELRADFDSKDLMVRADGTHWESLDRHQGPAEGTSGLDPDRQRRFGAILGGATGMPERIWALFDVIQYRLPSDERGYTRSPGRRRRSARAAEQRQLQRMRELDQRCGVELAGHRFILHRGRLDEGGNGPGLYPSYWWPDDRAWVVHTNIDCPTTYIAGSADLVERLLAEESLEAVEARLDHFFDGHTV